MKLSQNITADPKMLQSALKIYGRHRRVISRSVYLATFISIIARMRGSKRKPKSAEPNQNGTKTVSDTKNTKVEVDRQFMLRLLKLLRIIFPKPFYKAKDFWLLVVHSGLLVLRTLLSLYVATLDGQLVAALVKGKGRSFILGLVWWMCVAVPATFTNSMLQYLQGILAVRIRDKLTTYILNRYLPLGSTNKTPMYYAIHNLDDRIANADQLITADVAKFSESLAQLYSNLAKPMLDMILYSAQLSRSVGGESLFVIGMIVQMSAHALRVLTPPFGRYVAKEASLEGDFRFQHSRVIEASEEIALYRGQFLEKATLDISYFSLIKHVNRILRRRLYHGFLEDFIVKYFWGALGLVLCSVPVFFKNVAFLSDTAAMGDRTQKFVTNRRLLMQASDAFGRVMFSYKELAQLAGYTSRVDSLLTVMEDVKNGKMEKQMISSENTHRNLIASSNTNDNKKDAPKHLTKAENHKGKVVLGKDIVFKNVPIVSPNGDVLIRALSFEERQGQHLLVVGPNGSGKSSLFRILGGLWPVLGGEVEKPPSSDIFYIPQRPYLSRGTLRQQIIYPCSEKNNKVSDDELLEILKVVEIDQLISNNNYNWDTEHEWKEELSMGVQQRIAMARLFYHKPRFAILDECTSSVSLEIEKVMYTHARHLDISLMTVSHRPSLWRYHDHILQFDGHGGYVFAELDAEKRLRLEEEKLKIDLQLRSIPEWEKRLKELRQLPSQSLPANDEKPK